MIRTQAIALALAMLSASVCFGQFVQPIGNHQWVRPVTFEVTEAIGSGVRPAAPPQENTQFASMGTAIEQKHGANFQKIAKAPYPYAWTTRLGMLIMDRDNHNRGWLVDTAAGNAEILADEMGVSMGFKGSIIRHHEGRRDRELGFIGIFSDSGLNFGIVDDDMVLPTAPNLSLLDDGVMIDSYNSTLIGIEYNFRRRHDRITTLAGFRWLSLGERFLYNITAPAGPQVIGGQTETRNNLFGGQLGMEGVLVRRGCVHLEGALKAGAYWNMAEHETALAGVPAPGVVIVDENDDKIAFQGELDFVGVCQLNQTWNFRLGYQLMWLEGVALAPDQISAINVITNSGINTAGSPFYHGALVQLEGRF